MSLDVYLTTIEPEIKKSSSGIFVRENGQTKEITHEEWNMRYPNTEPVIFKEEEITETNTVYSANITHNLNTMASEAGIYEYLWRPDEINITKASELIDPLREGLHNLKIDPERYKKFNPENGWGSYDGLVNFVENYLNACYEYPDAIIEVSR
jgi:hypothetical protein